MAGSGKPARVRGRVGTADPDVGSLRVKVFASIDDVEVRDTGLGGRDARLEPGVARERENDRENRDRCTPMHTTHLRDAAQITILAVVLRK